MAPTPIDLALTTIRRQGAATILLKVMAPILGVFAVGLGLLAGWKMGVAILVFTVPMVLLMALLVYVGFTLPMLRGFRKAVAKPDRIAWIFELERVGNRSGRHLWLTIGLIDRKTIELQISHLPPELARGLVDHLRQLAPRAAYGFSDERAAAFQREPASLLASA